ncbi:MAG: hypothetical protein NVSMB10_19130 [Steroidobacteraceae bacterium]
MSECTAFGGPRGYRGNMINSLNKSTYAYCLTLSIAWWVGGAAFAASPDLYARLGGEAGVAAMTSTLIDRMAADPQHGQSFKDTDLPRIKAHLADQICQLSGGPCKYSGDSMREVHSGLHISQADFYTMVAVLRDVLNERHVELRATNELLRLLAPMKKDIVEPPRLAVR